MHPGSNRLLSVPNGHAMSIQQEARDSQISSPVARWEAVRAGYIGLLNARCLPVSMQEHCEQSAVPLRRERPYMH